MKRLISIVVILSALFLSSCQMGQTTFSFRNGVKFGMTPDEVIKCEGSTPNYSSSDADTYNNWEYIGWNNVDVSNYNAALRYFFNGNKLHIMRYSFEPLPDKDLENLVNSISSVYGKNKEATMDDMSLIFLSYIDPQYFDKEDFVPLYCWATDNGAKVFLYWDVPSPIVNFPGSYNLIYTDNSFDFSTLNSDVPNTNGL